MTFLTPLAALAAVAALLPLVAVAVGELRVRAARRALGLEPPSRSRRATRLACTAGAVALLGLAAAQPALTHAASARDRTGVAALFVIDSSGSMAAAAAPDSPTRLERAVDAAIRLRAAIPDVPAGIATLTDRVLPDLLPVPDAGGFDAVARRAVAIESPLPSSTSVTATSYGSLHEIPAGNYFTPETKHRIVVLLTDGESNPFDASSVANALSRSRGYRFVGLRFWNENERIYGPGGRADPGYQPNPIGASIMSGLAGATGGRSFSEGEVGTAAAYLRGLVGSGPSVRSGEIVQSEQPLAPFIAVVATILLLVAVAPAGAGAWVVGRTPRALRARTLRRARRAATHGAGRG